MQRELLLLYVVVVGGGFSGSGPGGGGGGGGSVLTLTRIIKFAVSGQAPVTLEVVEYPWEKIEQHRMWYRYAWYSIAEASR